MIIRIVGEGQWQVPDTEMRKKLLDGFARQQHHFGRRLVPDDVFVVFAIVQRVKFYIIAALLTPRR